MADRELPELRSRLRVDTSDLARAGRDVEGFQAKVGKPIKPSLDASGLQKFSSLLERNAQDLQRFGRTATRDLTLPLVAAGAASTKLALDFDTTFQRMVSLAGVAADEVDGLKEAVKKLASETGKSPQELAEGLEVIRSAGISGAKAMEVLESSAKASAIGLGTTRDVADAVTSVLQSYKNSNITAAQATDILAASVQSAKVEAADMAPQFGRILPVAAQLGIGFDQVAGSLAYLTLGSGDAAQASTQLNGVLLKLLNPGAQARDILAGVGLSVEQLQASLKERGLIPTLTLLQEKFGGNQQLMNRFLEDSQAIEGELGLIGGDAGKGAVKVIQDMGEASGKVPDAFAAFSKTDAFKIKQDFADVQTSMIELGEAIAPVVASIGSGVADIAEAFAGLPAPIRLGLLTVVGLVGPVSSALGKIGENIRRLRDIASRGANFFSGITSTAGSIAATGGVAALAAVGVGALTKSFLDAQARAAELKGGIENLQRQMEDTGKSAEELTKIDIAKLLSGGDVPDLSGEKNALGVLKQLGIGAKEAGSAITGTKAQYDAFRKSLLDQLAPPLERNAPETAQSIQARQDAEKRIHALDVLRAQLTGAVQQDKEYKAALGDLGVELDKTTTSTQQNTGATGENNDQRQTSIDLLVDHINKLTGFESANASAKDAITAYSDNEKAAAGQSREIEQIRSDAAKQEIDDQKNLTQLRKAAQQAARDVTTARRSEADAADGVTKAIEDEADAIRHENELKKKGAELQRDLTAALVEGEKQLAQGKRSAESDALRVKDAERAVQAARDQVNGFGSNGPVQDDPNTSVNERQAAIDNLAQQELALADAKDQAAESAAAQTQAEKDGVAGTPAVTDALTAIKDNNVALATAHQDVIDKAGAVEVANQRLADSHQGVTDALDKEAEANRAIGDAAEESRQKQKDALDKIATLTDEAKKKSDELKIAAETAVGAFITAAKDAGIPIDAITAGVKNLLEKALPDLKTGIETLFKDLVNPAFAPPGSEADQGLYSLGGGRSSKDPKQSIDKPGVTVPESTVPASAGLPQTYDSLPEGFYWFYDTEAQGWYGAKVPNRNADVALADITSRPPSGEKLPDGYYWYFDSKAGTWYSAKIPDKTTDVPLAEGAPVKKPASVLPASQLNLVYPQDGFYRPNGDIISPAEYVATVAAARKRKAEERLNNVADQPTPPSVIGGFTNTGNQRPSVRPVARGSKDLTGTTPAELAEAIVKAGKTGEGGKTIKVEAGAITVTIPVTGSMSDRQQQELKKTIRGEIDEALEKVAS